MGDSDRRKHPRGAVVATATIVAAGRWVGLYACENLSASGALLFGPDRLRRGDSVRVKLHLEGRGPVEVDARIVRQTQHPERPQPTYAVRFIKVAADHEDAIHNAVMDAIERQQGCARTRALVVHETELTRRAFIRDLRALGIEPVAAASFSEACDWLDDSEQVFAMIIIDGHMEPEQKVALLENVAQSRPGVRRLLVSGLSHPSLPQLALASGHAHAVVTQPWNLRALASALAWEEQSAAVLQALPSS